MRSLIPGLGLIGLSLALTSCNSGSTPTTTPTDTLGSPASGAQLPSGDVGMSPVIDKNTGANFEALGVWWLERNGDSAQLTMARAAAATQGDVYELSVRPFMTGQNLKLVRTQNVPDNCTDYTLEFTHPFAMPADVTRPATATKRTDLFLFDVQTVLVAPGEDSFFRGSVKSNTSMMPNADGYRMLEPMVNLASLGITDGTNVFPYKLLYNPMPGILTGNYTLDNGWLGEDHLQATGYDVVPQGASAEATLRVKNDLTGPVAVAVVAKYMDPRDGATIEEKRENRLPDPARPRSFRYFLPEASGDLQITTTTTSGTVREDATETTATITAHILDWDHQYPVATSFPDQTRPSSLKQASHVGQILASFPDLNAATDFIGTPGTTSGEVGEYIDVNIPIRNLDRTLTDIPALGIDVPGMIRLIDAQDLTENSAIVLDEDQNVVSTGNLLNARFALASVHVDPKMLVDNVTPNAGMPTKTVQFAVPVINGPATAYAWNFGTAGTPATSPLANPFVTLSQIEGTYQASVTVSHLDSEIEVPFTIDITAGVPTLPEEPLNYANLPLPRHYTDLEFPGGVIASSDNTPATNPTTDLGATLGRVLFYDVRLSQNYTKSCASCHAQADGFANTTRFSTGFNGAITTRNSMGLTNCRYYVNGRMFADERAATLEEQALMPIQDSKEMGLSLTDLKARLNSTPFYGGLFEDAFGDDAITDERIGKALAQFMRSIVSYRSKYDQAMSAGPDGTPDFEAVFTNDELHGLDLFQGTVDGISEPNMGCNQCHATGALTMGAAEHAASGQEEGPFKLNNGLGTAYYEPITTVDEFKASTLRNIALTPPYMHDGRFTSLTAVVNFYSTGVQNHANLHHLLRVNDLPGNPPEVFNLTPTQTGFLVAFLQTLTDEPMRTDPKYSNPFAIAP